MKIIKIRPLAVAALASVLLSGCASSDNMNDTTAMEDEVTMSETQTMGGNTSDMEDADAVVVTTEVSAPIATIPIAALSLKNPVEINEMFEDIGDTEQYDLMALAKTSPNLSTFVQLMETAGLSQDFMGDRSYTVFAPTNEAFSKLSQQDLEMLLLPENKAKLIEVLKVHVLPSEVGSTQFNSTQRIKISDDKYIPVQMELNGTKIMIGGAEIQVSDVEASNGLLHVVDNVILPSKYAQEDIIR
ncbi:fasciclin domain-containing protein [Pontibacter sp. MBLB2868]|uniref:fasciclin domain-containing protein n=1 Tax=Pontibacter sp. MBLB2868 TaxID=3451555 RepID=UPI003F74FFE6